MQNCLKFCMVSVSRMPAPERRQRRIKGQVNAKRLSTRSWPFAAVNGTKGIKRRQKRLPNAPSHYLVAAHEPLHQLYGVFPRNYRPGVALLVAASPASPACHLHVLLGTAHVLATHAALPPLGPIKPFELIEIANTSKLMIMSTKPWIDRPESRRQPRGCLAAPRHHTSGTHLRRSS